MQRVLQWNNFRKLLCIRTDNLGDVLMTEPALRSLKRSRPDREIHLLCSEAGSKATELISGVDKVIVCDPVWSNGIRQKPQAELIELAELLQKEQYDAAVIFNVYSQNPLPAAMLCYLAGINEVAAYCRENPYGLLSAWFPDDEPLFRIRHEVIRQMDLAWHLGGTRSNPRIRIRISDQARGSVSKKLIGLCGGEPFIIIHPGTSEQKRQYPAELFKEFARLAVGELDCRLLVTGSPTEKDLADHIADIGSDKICSVAGMFDIPEFAALIASAELLVSNNTGPVHIASATNTPAVVLYAQTNPQHTPWMLDHALLPFDIPASKRSQNTIIRFAHEQSFNPVTMAEPEKILKSTLSLLARPNRFDHSLNEYP